MDRKFFLLYLRWYRSSAILMYDTVNRSRMGLLFP